MGMKRKEYEAALEPLTLELVSMARWVKASGARVVVLTPTKSRRMSSKPSGAGLPCEPWRVLM